jgi:tyrosyl-tRNA synthetase
MVHGAESATAAQLAGKALFGQADLAELDEATLTQALAEAGLVDVARVDSQLPSVADLFVAAGVTPSKGAARRAVEEGGAYVNNVKVADGDAALEESALLHGGLVVLRRGKKTIAGARILE